MQRMNKFPLLLALASTLAVSSADGQRSTGTILRDDITDCGRDAGFIFGSPAHFSQDDWLTVAAVGGGVAAVMPLDESVRTFFRQQHGPAQDAVMNVGQLYGSVVPAILIGAGIYAGGLVGESDETRMTGREVLESLAFAGIVTTSLKILFGRSRPYTDEGAGNFKFLQFSDDRASFPSGHATVAFAVSSVLAARIHDDWVSAGLYTLAGVTAISRVYHDQHWASDVFLGSAIGGIIGRSIVLHHTGQKEQTLSVSPVPLVIHLRFPI